MMNSGSNERDRELTFLTGRRIFECAERSEERIRAGLSVLLASADNDPLDRRVSNLFASRNGIWILNRHKAETTRDRGQGFKGQIHSGDIGAPYRDSARRGDRR